MSPTLGTAAGWLYFAALSLAIGALAFRLVVTPGAHGLDEATRHRLNRGSARLGAVAAIGLGLSLPILVMRQADG